LDIRSSKDYKYLGYILDQKLNGKKCTQKFAEKMNHIRLTLGPLLSNCSLEYKKNIWQVFILPLCDFLTPYYFFEGSKSRKKNIKTLVRKSFKTICLLMGYQINEREDQVIMISEEKYVYRLEKIIPNKVETISHYNYCLHQPKSATEFLNLTTKQCKLCKTKYPNVYIKVTPEHLTEAHGVSIKSFEEIFGCTKKLEQQERIEITLKGLRYSQINKRNIKIHLNELYID
jgi:hypothetical protein